MTCNSLRWLALGLLLLSAGGIVVAQTMAPIREAEVSIRTRPVGGIRSAGTPAILLPTVDPRPSGASVHRGAGSSIKISAATMAGSVRSFAVSPDGATAVYLADQVTIGRVELYATPVDGSSTPITLSTGLVFGTGDEGVSTFQISPDGANVAFLADANSGGGVDDLYSVPIDGSTGAVQLSVAAMAPVTGLGITPDSATVAFFAQDIASGSGATELHAASIGVASSAQQISDASAGNANGNVVAAIFSPDSSRAVYAADAGSDDVFQWYGVPLGASGPGSDTQLSSALGSVTLAEVSPDNSTVVYVGDDNVLGILDVFSVPISGGSPVKLNPGMAGDGVNTIQVSADGTKVGYLADQQTDGVSEVHAAAIAGAGSGTRLNTPLLGTQYADVLTLSPDGGTVVYEADENTVGTIDLLSVPIDGSAQPTTLHGLAIPQSAGSFVGRGTPVLGRRAVYPVFGAAVDLFSVPIDGAAEATQLNDVLSAGDALFNVYVPAVATQLVAYGIGSQSEGATRDIFSAAARGNLPREQVNVSATSGDVGVLGYQITADEEFAVYVQDQTTSGKPELYAHGLDSDDDGTPNATDNCKFVANPGQNPVPFGQVVRSTLGVFVWDLTADVRFVRGFLASVSTLSIDETGVLVDAVSYDDGFAPGAGAGRFYLFATDCDGRSYQTVPGTEPGRDLAGLP
ncbi:MAG: hypothetical protein OES25_12450 [Acidobacteriota bacterium]|nr:hypothetical protein [Acidobacteriota bacterium]